MSSALRAAIVARDPDALSAAMYDELIPVIDNDTDPATYDPREKGSSGGNVFKGVAWQGKNWWRDDSSVAAADNVTCIILLDGGHYLTNEVTFPQTVESRTVSAPPDSAGTDPSVVGKAWRVPAAATDTWAGHDDDVAMGSARGWLFHTPGVGEEHYVRDEKVYESFTEDNVWVDRTAAFGTVWPANFGWDNRVQNQTTNSPPSSWSKGVAYIIGSSPTGAWSGDAGKIALAESDGVLADGDTFTIITPYVGQQVYDIAQAKRYRWTGTTWTSDAGAFINYASSGIIAASVSGTSTGGSGGQTYSSSVAPSTTKASHYDPSAKISAYAARGSKLLIRYVAELTNMGGGSGAWIVGIRRDSETNAIAWRKLFIAGSASEVSVDLMFSVPVSDNSTHDYTFVTFQTDAGTQGTPTFDRREMILMEAA